MPPLPVMAPLNTKVPLPLPLKVTLSSSVMSLAML